MLYILAGYQVQWRTLPSLWPCSFALIIDSERQMIYASGSIPLDPVSMQVVEGGVEAQTVRPLQTPCAAGSAHDK